MFYEWCKDNNELNGSIPSELGNLHSLEVLYIGKFDDKRWIANIFNTRTKTINFTFCINKFVTGKGNEEISGQIPSDIGNLNNLKWLHLRESFPINLEFRNFATIF